MLIANGVKFVSLKEIADHLNAMKKPEEHYSVPELACAWADTRAKVFQETGKQVEANVHYITDGAEAVNLLSLSGCELIEKYATVDAHDVPLIADGVAELFN